MGFGSILGGIVGSIIPGIGTAAGAGIGGALEGATKGGGGAAKPVNAANHTFIPAGVTGKGLTGFNTIDMPAYPNMPGYEDMPSLPSNMALMPAKFMPATQGEKKMGGAIDASQLLTLAALDPNHPIIRKLTQANEEGANRDFASAMRDMMVASQRQQARGRTGYFNPERGDSDAITAIMNQAANNRIGARGLAQQQAMQGASGMREVGSSYGNLANQETGRRNSFMDQLALMIQQMREDTKARTQTAQTNSLNRQNMRREDILAPFEYASTNANNAMRSANTAGTANMANIQDYQGRKAGLQSANTDAIGKLLSGIFGQGAPA